MEIENVVLAAQERVQIIMLYWGQMFFHKKAGGNFCEILMITNANRANIIAALYQAENVPCEQLSVCVKPLSKISDHECVKLYGFLWPDDKVLKTEVRIFTVRSGLNNLGLIEYAEARDMFTNRYAVKAIDYLREHGWALPYKNWSVDELVKFGIFKLTE